MIGQVMKVNKEGVVDDLMHRWICYKRYDEMYVDLRGNLL